MNSQLRENAIKLRKERNLSYSEIRRRLNVPKSTLSYWLRDFPLTEERILELRRRGWKKGEVGRERFRATMKRKKKLKEQEIYNKYQEKFKNFPKEAFFMAGLALYLGEGSKRDYSRVVLTNTNPKIIRFFIQWLEEFFGVQKDELKVFLHLYENMDLMREKNFWKGELGLKEEQFYKLYIQKLKKASFSYKESFCHGTCSIYLGGVGIKREIMMAIQALFDEFEKRLRGD